MNLPAYKRVAVYNCDYLWRDYQKRLALKEHLGEEKFHLLQDLSVKGVKLILFPHFLKLFLKSLKFSIP